MVAKVEQLTQSPKRLDTVVSDVNLTAFFRSVRTPPPAKLGSYHCNNRVYSIGHGRWLSPDQAKSPYWNLFDYVLQHSIAIADPTGLGITVRVSTRHASGETEDSVEQVADAVSHGSASHPCHVYSIMWNQYTLCMATNPGGNCCIERLEIYGHCDSGIGGGAGAQRLVPEIDPQTGRPTGQAQWYQDCTKFPLECKIGIQNLLCSNATIVNNQCFGLKVHWETPCDANRQWIELLEAKGGIYKGYTNVVRYKWWTDSNGTKRYKVFSDAQKDPGRWGDVKVEAGDDWAKIQDRNKSKVEEVYEKYGSDPDKTKREAKK